MIYDRAHAHPFESFVRDEKRQRPTLPRAAHYSVSGARESRCLHVRFERGTRPAASPAIGASRRHAIGSHNSVAALDTPHARLTQSLETYLATSEGLSHTNFRKGHNERNKE